jgi:hypothetical protein
MIRDYYGFSIPAPFIYRILPALLCRGIMFGHANVATGLNAPVDSYYNIFQLGLDTVSLIAAFLFMVGIARQLNPQLPLPLIMSFAGASALMTVVFGYFMVPNRALFFPYDFPDFCIAAIIFYLCIKAESTAITLIPIAVLIGALNKETTLFYCGMYIALNASSRSTWKRIAGVMFFSVVAFVLARVATVFLIQKLAVSASTFGSQYEYHLSDTLKQFRNPLLVFSLFNICSYLYLPVIVMALRKRLDRTDYCILVMVAVWIVIMATFGIIRELRLFVPASIMLFVILARHLSEAIRMSEPRVRQLFRVIARI